MHWKTKNISIVMWAYRQQWMQKKKEKCLILKDEKPLLPFLIILSFIIFEINWKTFTCMKGTKPLIDSYKINRQTDRNAASMFRSLDVERQHPVPILAGKKVPLFKCAILSRSSWNRWVIKLDWASSPTLQSAGSLWYEGGRLSHNHLLMICLTAAMFLWVTVCFS